MQFSKLGHPWNKLGHPLKYDTQVATFIEVGTSIKVVKVGTAMMLLDSKDGTPIRVVKMGHPQVLGIKNRA